MRLFAALVLLLAMVNAQAVDLEGDQLARYHELNAELRCLICQNRSIAESDAPLAKDLRTIVEKQIAQGRSDAEIKQYLVDRYGKWVLYDPPLDSATLILWIGPFVLLAIGLLVVVLMMRRRREAPPERPSLDRDRLTRVLDEQTQPTDSASSKERS
ncbi:C-type cytochrome biosis protein [Salinisphaera shabanensis E1L3A]|uniref:Cytochrome c-type biogenesis protein n=1 Tax=Salinisphaera shabanensis E1L3A TaxID=1033802 RepID=F7QBL0_9GAMM|nr:cytochrome c-type biogenesis protein [Salinisphaera shabanensis]ERJ18509.1 C-type cytochrome biosis protein [Salinisphaera shabanensis E1L3A]